MARKRRDDNRGIITPIAVIERAAGDSKQPRFNEKEAENFFFSALHWFNAEAVPEWLPNTMARDAWLLKFAKNEPHLQGILHSMISIDANRGWELTGGRNQVLRYVDALHNWQVAPGVLGWRPGCAALAGGFYQTDIGGKAEVARQSKNGPVRGFYHVDPSRCRMTGNADTPLRYSPLVGKNTKQQNWREMDYLSVVSMPAVEEQYNGIGFCFVSRIREFAEIMVAIWRHDKEELGAQAPRGLLLLNGITQTQWEQAMASRKTQMEGQGWQYYENVAVLAGMGMPIDAKLVALSNLPKGFTLQQWIALYMYGMALCAGYDPSEFYPVQFGSLGRGTETEVQHEKATGKGGKNFALGLQEQLQRQDILPETLHFEFQERDEAAEVEEAKKYAAWNDLFRAIRETGLQATGIGGISNEEYRMLLAEKGIIPSEWTLTEEPVTADDEASEERRRKLRLERKRAELLSSATVYRATMAYPREPIITYQWPLNCTETLAQSGEDLIRRRSYPVAKRRQVDTSQVYFEDKATGIIITEAMVDRAIEDGRRRLGEEWGSMLDNEPLEVEA